MSEAAEGKVGTTTMVMAVLVAVMVAGCMSNGGELETSDEVAATAGLGTARVPDQTGTDREDPAETTGDVAAADETTAEETSGAETSEAPVDASETEPASTEEEAAPSGDVIVVSEWAAFTTPAQAAYCIISAPANGMAASISCEVAQSSVPSGEPLMGVCDAEGIGWFFNFFADTGHGGFFCNHVDGITRGGGNPHYWQDDPWIDPNSVVTLPSGAKVAVLDYGRVMRAGDMDCTVQPDGLTCHTSGSGHGFTVNSGSYSTW